MRNLVRTGVRARQHAVEFVDEQDDPFSGFVKLSGQNLEAFLELTPVARAGLQCSPG